MLGPCQRKVGHRTVSASATTLRVYQIRERYRIQVPAPPVGDMLVRGRAVCVSAEDLRTRLRCAGMP